MGQASGNQVRPVDVRDYLSHDLNITMTDSEIQPWIDAAKRHQRLHAAEHRAAVVLDEMSLVANFTGFRPQIGGSEHIIDVCARVREARADVDDLGRGL